MMEQHNQRWQPTAVPVRYRIVRDGINPQMSESVEAVIRDLGMEGLVLETACIKVDGLHISYDDHPGEKNHVFLQWDFRPGRSLKAIGETVWYERLSAAEAYYVVGLKFLDMSEEDERALRESLGPCMEPLSSKL